VVADYCTLADAQTLIPGVAISASTVPSSTTAADYPVQISAELTVLLRSCGSALPVTDTVLLADLKATAKYGVAALILQAKFGKDEAAAATLWVRYDKGQQAIRDREAAAAGVVAQHLGEGFTLDADGKARVPKVTKDMVF
jgi:hypothetical protein